MHKGRGTLLAEVDIRDAYRLIPIHPHNRPLLGMSSDNQLYVNLALPFGSRSAPFIFNKFAEAWHWILHHRHGIRYLLHYLDDYLTAGALNSRECHNNFSSIWSSASSLLGDPTGPGENRRPQCCTVLSFLGIELDTCVLSPAFRQRSSLLCSLPQSCSHKRVCRRQELESLLGHLHHAAKVIYPGRPFLRSLTDLLRGTRSQSRFIRLNRDARADLLWWASFIRDCNGTSFFISPHWSHLSNLQVSTDAAGATGFGAYLDDLWFAGCWVPEKLSASIAFKERSGPRLGPSVVRSPSPVPL